MNAHQDVLASLDIRRVAEALGLEVHEAGACFYCRCPVTAHEHDGSRPRCQLGGEEDHLWHCHKCGQGGDAVGLVKAVRGCDAAVAFTWLRQRGFLPDRSGRAAGADRAPDGPLHELAMRRDWAVEALEALGAVEHQQNGRPAEVRFPMRDADGEVTGWRRRRADNQPFGEAGKCLTRKGDKNGLICPWPLPDPEHDPVLVVEGEADAVAALSALAGIPVAATPGANPGKDCLKYLQTLLPGRSVVLAPHPDGSGADWRNRTGRALQNVQCDVRYVPPEGGDPLGALLLKLAGERRWQGSASELLDTLEGMLEDECGPNRATKIMRGKRWPSAPHVLGARLQRLVPQLEAAGIAARRGRSGSSGRAWILEPEVLSWTCWPACESNRPTLSCSAGSYWTLGRSGISLRQTRSSGGRRRWLA